MSFLINGEHFAADVALVQKIERNLDVTPVPSAPKAVAGIANMKGKPITLLCAAALLNRGLDASGDVPRKVSAVVFKPFAGEDDQMGLLIDRSGDLIEIDEAKLIPPPLVDNVETAFYISGVYELDGTLYRLLDIEAIIGRFRNGVEPQGGIIDEKSL